MTYENLWDIPSVNEVLNSTDNIFDIMKAQGQYLKENTNGRIFGKFSKIKTINPLSTMGAALTAFAPREVLQNNDSSALADANELYRDQKYGFEIYNSAYKFRVFEMIILPVYPAQIIIDEGVVSTIEDEIALCAEKGKTANHYIIKNDDELIGCLRLILSSKKVRYILYKLQQQSENNQKA